MGAGTDDEMDTLVDLAEAAKVVEDRESGEGVEGEAAVRDSPGKHTKPWASNELGAALSGKSATQRRACSAAVAVRVQKRLKPWVFSEMVVLARLVPPLALLLLLGLPAARYPPPQPYPQPYPPPQQDYLQQYHQQQQKQRQKQRRRRQQWGPVPPLSSAPPCFQRPQAYSCPRCRRRRRRRLRRATA